MVLKDERNKLIKNLKLLKAGLLSYLADSETRLAEDILDVNSEVPGRMFILDGYLKTLERLKTVDFLIKEKEQA